MGWDGEEGKHAPKEVHRQTSTLMARDGIHSNFVPCKVAICAKPGPGWVNKT